MSKKQWAETKTRRTKSWQSQPEFDNMLGDLDISSLRMLKQKREGDLRSYKTNNDMSNPDIFEEYTYLQQNYKMICDELTHREMDIRASKMPKERFDSETGLVLDEHGKPIYSIDYNSEEDSLIYRDNTGTILSENNEDDNDGKRKSRTRKEVYEGWDYSAKD